MFDDFNTKKCTKCFVLKDIALYNKKRNALQSWCKQCESQRTKIWYEKNKEKRNKKAREWESNNRDKVNFAKRARREKAKSLLPPQIKKDLFDRSKWNSQNKHRLAKYKRDWLKKNPIASLSDRVRRRINQAFKLFNYTKRSKTNEILGCDWETFKNHMERQFVKGMTWENRSQWHIDHIIPIATAKTEEDVVRLNHYTNLRPLWAHENLAKSAKVEYLL